MELHDMMGSMCDAFNMNTKRLKRVLGLVEQMDTMVTHLPVTPDFGRQPE
jgi:hypothetical protein